MTGNFWKGVVRSKLGCKMGHCMKKVENSCPKGYAYPIQEPLIYPKKIFATIHWYSEEWYRGRWKFGLEPRYAYCYTLCVNRWIANKERQVPRRNFDARCSLSYVKNICFLDIAQTSGFQPGSGGPTEVVNHLWKGCQKVFHVHSCISFALSEFRWRWLVYSGLIQWVTVQKGLKTTGLDTSVKITSDVWTHPPQFCCMA